jgi:chloride channel protein, CIC family
VVDHPPRSTGAGADAKQRYWSRLSIGLSRLRIPFAARRLLKSPARSWAAVRLWVRGGEVGLVGLAILAGAASGFIVAAMRFTTYIMHVTFYGNEAHYGLSALEFSQGEEHKTAAFLLVLLFPALGGLLLGVINIGIARVWPRTPIDPIEANALYGGVMSLRDAGVVAAQNIVSNGFGASVGLEAAYTQVGSSAASRIGRLFNLRRTDLRVLVGCGSAGAIAAAFGAPLTGAFYAFELVIGNYAISSLIPVIASAVTASQISYLLSGPSLIAQTGGVGTPSWLDYGLALVVGVLCGLVGIALMRGMTLVEHIMRKCVPWA